MIQVLLTVLIIVRSQGYKFRVANTTLPILVSCSTHKTNKLCNTRNVVASYGSLAGGSPAQPDIYILLHLTASINSTSDVSRNVNYLCPLYASTYRQGVSTFLRQAHCSNTSMGPPRLTRDGLVV